MNVSPTAEVPTPLFDSGCKKILDGMLLTIPVVTTGQMFGYPAYFVKGKLFACLYGTSVALKLEANAVQRLLKSGKPIFESFHPMGRTMKEWIQINRKRSADYRRDSDLFAMSIKFVAAQFPKGKLRA